MLELEIMNLIKKFCRDQGFDYYKTLIFVDVHLKTTESLLKRKMNRLEVAEEIKMIIIYLSEYGEKEGLKINYRE